MTKIEKSNLEITLTENQQKFFKQLGFIKSKGFYLAGGTALALQIGHRQSVDFDFYSQKHFKKGVFIELFKNHFPEQKIKIVRDINDTFEIAVEPDIHLSCFFYSYSLIVAPITINNVRIASLQDIAAMKLVAISQRGVQRDFIDAFYLLKRYSLKEIIRFAQEKYPEFDIYNGLRGLLYFKEADEEKDKRIKLFDQNINWSEIKKHIIKTVRDFQNLKS